MANCTPSDNYPTAEIFSNASLSGMIEVERNKTKRRLPAKSPRCGDFPILYYNEIFCTL